jgi:hypothetical protein
MRGMYREAKDSKDTKEAKEGPGRSEGEGDRKDREAKDSKDTKEVKEVGWRAGGSGERGGSPGGGGSPAWVLTDYGFMVLWFYEDDDRFAG